ncbi:MAG: hypothetical protein M3Z28_06015, partial [Candidatus Dormibacteraeota bacterium]|nr:hypothetical protein [Candidatus Dormibacteraeota bacterium]
RVVRLTRMGSMLTYSYVRPAVLAFSANGRCILSLHGERWAQADLDRIWRHLGLTPEGGWNDLVDETDLKTRFPGAF